MRKFQIGDKVVVIGNAHGMFILNDIYPIRATIRNISVQGPNQGQQPTTEDGGLPCSGHREYYYINFDEKEHQVKAGLRDHSNSRTNWCFAENLLRKDNCCPVCNKEIQVCSGRIAEHDGTNDRLCWGSFLFLDLL